MNDAPVKLITISGIFNAPDNRPLPGITLKLRTRKYTNRLFQNEEISCVTGRGGEYSLSVLPGDYEASCAFKPTERGEVLGVVHIEPDSIDGTLNDFLGLTAGMSYPPSIMVKIIEWVDLAEYYAEQAQQAAADAGFIPRGEYDPAAEYATNDLVRSGGSEYRATVAIKDIAPPAAPWELFVEKGDKGDQGPPIELVIGAVNTLPPGSPAAATLTVDGNEQVLNLDIPEGVAGKIVSIDDFSVSPEGALTLASATGNISNPAKDMTFTPTGEMLTEVCYIRSSHKTTIDLNHIESLMGHGLSDGYTLRIFASAITAGASLAFKKSGSFYWVDGSTVSNPVVTFTEANEFYLYKIVLIYGAGVIVIQESPPRGAPADGVQVN